MTTIETKKARLNELKAELAEIRAEMKDASTSNARWGRLQNYRYEIRCEIEKLQAEIDAEIDANIKKVAAQKVDAILTSGVQPVIVNTTFKNNRCSVNIDGAKVSLDKAVTILCESELARCGENVLLINENFDVCPLDEDLFILGKHNVKTAIRQFARGEKVTGAKVLNGKFYPVVKANAEPAAEPAVEETAIAETEPVEDNPRRFMATIYFETVNSARGCDSVEVPNAQLAAQAAIDYVASHADRKVTTVYINDFVACSEYITTDADITALYPVEETAIVEPANVEESDREKYLKAKEQIKAAPDRLLDNGNFTTKWLVRDEHGNWNRTNKGNAATILNAFGLDIFTYLDEHEKWVAENVAISAINAAAEDFARSIVAPAKMLALPAPAPVAESVKYVATQITFPTGHEGEPTREVSKTFDNLDDAAKFIADDNPFIETATGCHTFAYDDGYFGGVYWAGYRIETTDGKILVEADIYEVKGDESIDNLIIKYINANDNDTTAPESPADNPLACLNNLGYEDDVIEPVYGTVDETASSQEYAVTIAQLKDAYDSAVAAWSAIDYNARTHKSLRPVAKTALATVTAAGTALQAFGDAHLAQLCPLLDQTIRGATIRIINEDGIDWGSQKLADISLKFRRTGPDFAIIANDNYYATCATPDDVRRVIDRLKQSITCGAAEFSFAPQNFTPEPVDDDADDDEYASISEDGITYVPLARGHNVSADRFYLKVQGFPVTEYQRTTASPSDTVAGVARICATVNAVAPKGWEVYYDTPSKLFAVTHNDETVARLTSVELYDAWDAHPPEDFFNAYDTHDVVEFDDDGNISAVWF